MKKTSKPAAKKSAAKAPTKSVGKFPTIVKGKKSGVQIRIETLAKLANEASKVIAADKGKSSQKILVDKVKAKMQPPSKARIAVTIANAAKEVGKSHEQVVAAFLTMKAYKGVFNKVSKKLGLILNDDETLEEIDAMNTAIIKFVESTYSLGRKRKSETFVDPGDAEDEEVEDEVEVEEEVEVPKSKNKVKAPIKKSTSKKKFFDPGDED